MLATALRYLRLFFRLQLTRLRVQLEYDVDFWLGILGVFLISGANFTFVWVLFSQTPRLGGWSIWEAALLYGLATVPKGLVDLFCDGVWQTSVQVHTGAFDRALLRPLPIALQVFSWSSKLHGFGQFLFGGWLVISAFNHLGLEWTLFRIVFVAATFVNSLLLIGGVVLAANSSSFWTRDQSNAFAVFVAILSDAVQVPVTVYGSAIKFLLTWVLPFAFVSYYPACVLLGKPIEPTWARWVFPLSGTTTALAMYLLWSAGLARYDSTGQ